MSVYGVDNAPDREFDVEAPDAVGISHPSRLLGLLPVVAAATAAGLAVIVLFGWAVHSAALTSVVPSLPTMKVNTALAFLLSALTLAMLRDPTPARRRIAAAAALTMGLFAVLTLVEWLSGRSLGIDQVFVHDFTKGAGRASPQTALAFLLFGISQLTLDAHGPIRRRAHLLSLVGFGLTVLVAAVGYLYGSAVLTGHGSLAGVAITTVASLAVVFVGAVAQRPDRDPLRRLRGATTGATLVRRAAIAVLLVPALLGFLRLLGQQAGWYDVRFGLALFTVSMMLVFAGLIALHAGTMERHDRARRVAAEATRRSERRFRALTKLAPIGIFETNPHGVCAFVNPRWCGITGLTSDEAVGRLWTTAVHPGDHATVQSRWNEAATRVTELALEYRVLRADGVEAWVAARCAPIRDEHGILTGFLGTLTDITSLKRAEQAASVDAARMQALLDHAPMPLSLRDLDGRYVLLNQALAGVLGDTIENLLGKPSPDDDRETARRIDEQERSVREGGGASTYDLRYPHPDGTDHDYLVTKYPVIDNQGTVTGVGAITIDVTDQVQAKRRLQEAEERFRLAFDDAPIGIALVSPGRRWLQVNRALCEITGYDEVALLATTPRGITHPDDLDADSELVRQLLAGEIRTAESEKRFVCADGSSVWVLVRLSRPRYGRAAELFDLAVPGHRRAQARQRKVHRSPRVRP